MDFSVVIKFWRRAEDYFDQFARCLNRLKRALLNNRTGDAPGKLFLAVTSQNRPNVFLVPLADDFLGRQIRFRRLFFESHEERLVFLEGKTHPNLQTGLTTAQCRAKFCRLWKLRRGFQNCVDVAEVALQKSCLETLRRQSRFGSRQRFAVTVNAKDSDFLAEPFENFLAVSAAAQRAIDKNVAILI